VAVRANRSTRTARNGQGKATNQAQDVTNGAKMLERVASGMTITDAAQSLKISRKHGDDLYRRQLQQAMQESGELRQMLLAQDIETLRLLIRAFMPGALRGLAEDARIVLQALDRRAKLLGLDAAVKVEISQARINDTVDEIVTLLDDATDDDLADVLEIEAAREAR
jgi:hypothetical protein